MNLFRFFIYAFFLVATTAGLSYVEAKKPEIFKQLIVKVDVFGLSEAASQEKSRLAQIKALQIPFEQKKVLMERSIFMGATRQMVYLALGQPDEAKDLRKDKTTKDLPKNQRNEERWVFYFKDESRPTILEFRDGTLVSAYKGSKLDV